MYDKLWSHTLIALLFSFSMRKTAVPAFNFSAELPPLSRSFDLTIILNIEKVEIFLVYLSNEAIL